MVHQLKLNGTSLADAVSSGDKRYEIRLNDRNYKVGDILYQVAYSPEEKQYIKHEVSQMTYVVSYMSYISPADGEYCVMSIRPAFASSILIRTLLKFYKRKGISINLIMFGEVLYDCKIIEIGDSTLSVKVRGNVHTVNIEDVVWAAPEDIGIDEVPGRSMLFDEIMLYLIVGHNEFADLRAYQLFRERLMAE